MQVTHRRSPGDLPASHFEDGRLEALQEWGRRLEALGVAPEASGNLSCRSQNGFLITRTGVPLGEIQREDWVEVTGVTARSDGGLEVESSGNHEPSRDASVHAAIYGRDPGAMAVFHLHPDYLETLSDVIGVPTTERHQLAGTVESVQEIQSFLDDHPDLTFFVLVEHGIVAWADAIDRAGELVEAHHLQAMGA